MDKRVIKTRNNLNKALVQLLRDKPLSKVTVSELCQLADINRSTYYLHYRDAYDQYEQLEASLYQEFSDTIDTFIDSHQLWFNDLIDAAQTTQAKLLEELFIYIKKNALTYGSILPMNQGNELLNKLYAVGYQRFFSSVEAHANQATKDRFEYFYSFVASGCIGVLRQWVDRGMPESPKEMSQITIQLVHGATPLSDG